MKAFSLPAEVSATYLTGVVEAAAPAVWEAVAHEAGAPLSVLFLQREGQADAIEEALRIFASGRPGPAVEVIHLPAETEDPEEDPRALDRACDRLAALTRLRDLSVQQVVTREKAKIFLLTSPRGFFAPVPDPEHLSAKELRLKPGQRIQLEELAIRLAGQLGYSNEVVCETPAQFAQRGGILDVYPVNSTAPVRIDFFGDEIDELRHFDPTSQRSAEAIKEVIIAGVGDSQSGNDPEGIYHYLPKRVTWILPEPVSLIDEFRPYFEEFERMETRHPTIAGLARRRITAGQKDTWIAVGELDEEPALLESAERRELETGDLVSLREGTGFEDIGRDATAASEAARGRFFRLLAKWQTEKTALRFLVANEAEAHRWRELLTEAGVQTDDEDWLPHALHRGFIIRKVGRKTPLPFAAGWPNSAKAIAYISQDDLIGRKRRHPPAVRRRKLPERTQVDQLLDFSELVEGDYLVHLSQGICRFRGLQKMALGGRKEEVISLEFDESLTLHVPLWEAHLLSRYVGLTKKAPKLARLGTGQWDRTRRAAEKATLDFAAELLRLQATREKGNGFAYSTDGPWMQEFEASFEFTETPDQAKAIQEAKGDMEEAAPMDRLVCGDVGFGKTEVALRAAFKAVADGKQVAVLVPTTVLAQQHENTFRERLAPFPVSVEMLSRFRTKQEQKEILDRVGQGRVDILIGTHRLLSKDVQFRDLGLLVIDEEHRFGVRHKERLKKFREHVDVLTMSATPIPRTLYLALMGARDLSVIETPPRDRLPIQTVVRGYDPKMVKEAIEQEVGRGGQVFYLHNRVQSIEAVARRLKEMLPKSRIGVGHGQMTEGALEKIMTRFVAGEYDILVCTTIIESGLDIPNCNTIIIEGADRFGLSQLYQLRGRVGRFTRQAYAYLLLHRHARIVDTARKRLAAMRQYNQLGAGFRIAMRDLELRGAGNLLGAQQSGHIAGVGFDLYCQLLRQSVARLKGEPTASILRASVRLDFVNLGQGTTREEGETRIGFDVLKEEEIAEHRIPVVEAYIPTDYIGETRLRLDFYRKMAVAVNLEEMEEIRASLKDRFGALPQAVRYLLDLSEIRVRAELSGIISVVSEGNRLKCLRASGKRDDYVKTGSRFPRLTGCDATRRLREIKHFIARQESSPR